MTITRSSSNWSTGQHFLEPPEPQHDRINCGDELLVSSAHGQCRNVDVLFTGCELPSQSLRPLIAV
jgi:hypothetical protein